jgi:SWI/SNF-related matrix-associated actin-dependent regulator of chromatin subfamily A-like protein 1
MIDLDQDEDGSVTVRLRVSAERWDEAQAALEGIRWDRDRRVNILQLPLLPTILKRLRESNLPVRVSTKLTRAIQHHTIQQWYDLKAAQERAKLLDEELRKRGLSLYPFQRRGVEWLSTSHGALLADEMGLGKTVQAIAAIPAKAPIIVVAPAVAKGVWYREVLKWRPSLRVSVLQGVESFRWPKPGEMLVTNYQVLPNIHREGCDGTLPRLPCRGCAVEMSPYGLLVKAEGHSKKCDGFLKAEHCPGCAKFLRLVPEGTVLIADEAHNLKNGKAIRSKRFRAISQVVRSKAGRVWLLTATPLLNQPTELWSVCQAAGIAQEAFGNWKNFTKEFGAKPKTWGGFEWGKPSDKVVDKLRRVSLRRMRDEVLPQLPVKTWENYPVPLTKKVVRQCDDLLAKLGGIERVMKLIRGEGIDFRTMATVRMALAAAKLPSLLNLVDEMEEDSDSPLVVFSAHRLPVDTLAKRKGWVSITGDTPPAERTSIEEAFQVGRYRGIACTIRAGGVAITLTRSHRAIFLDREFTPALNSQAEDRVCRIGQSRGVIITNLVADHQLDERLTELLTVKGNLIASTVDASSETATDESQERVLKDLRVSVEGFADRFPAEGVREKRALKLLSTLDFAREDAALAKKLAQEAVSIGLSKKQWALAERLCSRTMATRR